MDPSPTSATPVLGGFDPALLERCLADGRLLETGAGLLPAPLQPPPLDRELVDHERSLLAAVLQGEQDQRDRWGQFRRSIGLRFDDPVPASLWSDPCHRLLAVEIDALFLGQRDIAVLHATALREDLQQRALSGRFQGSLQQLDTALASVLAWADSAHSLEFRLACQLFQTAKARQLFYAGLRQLLGRERQDSAIDAELEHARSLLNEATALTAGRCRSTRSVHRSADAVHEGLALASLPAEQRPKPISTGIPSLDLDMRGGILPGAGESTWVLAARSGIGKTTVAIAAAMGLALNGAGVLVFSCELSRRAIGARLLAHYCRRANGHYTPAYGTNDLEGRGRVIEGEQLQRLQDWGQRFADGLTPAGTPMGTLLYQSQFAATAEDVAALVEDSKSAHPELSCVVLDHFHAMGPSPGYGSNSTAELAARAMALKALAGRCELDILLVAQLNRGAYGSPAGPDVSHLAGTSELERYASAVWLLDRPKAGDGPPPPPGLLEIHHGKFRHGQMAEDDLGKTLIRLDRSHCFLEADEARRVFCGSSLYPGVEAL